MRLCCCLVGEHLRLCPQDYTCCTSQMEETLSLQSEKDFLRAVEDSSQFLLTTFTQRHRRFDGEDARPAPSLTQNRGRRAKELKPGLNFMKFNQKKPNKTNCRVLLKAAIWLGLGLLGEKSQGRRLAAE